MKKIISALLSAGLLAAALPQPFVHAKDYTPYDYISVEYNRDGFATSSEIADTNNYDSSNRAVNALANKGLPLTASSPAVTDGVYTLSNGRVAFASDKVGTKYDSTTKIFTGDETTYKTGDFTSTANVYAAESGGIAINQTAEKLSLLMTSGTTATAANIGVIKITYEGEKKPVEKYYIIPHTLNTSLAESLYVYSSSGEFTQTKTDAEKSALNNKNIGDLTLNCLMDGKEVLLGTIVPFAQAAQLRKGRNALKNGSVSEVVFDVDPTKTITKIEIENLGSRLNTYGIFKCIDKDKNDENAQIKPSAEKDAAVSETIKYLYAAAYLPVKVAGTDDVYYMKVSRNGAAVLAVTAIQKTLKEKISQIEAEIAALSDTFSESEADKISDIRAQINELLEYDNVTEANFDAEALKKLSDLEAAAREIIQKGIEDDIAGLPSAEALTIADKAALESIRTRINNFTGTGGEISAEALSKFTALEAEMVLIEKEQTEKTMYKENDLEYNRDVFASKNFADSIVEMLGSNTAGMNEVGLSGLSNWTDGVFYVGEVPFKFGPLGDEKNNNTAPNALHADEASPAGTVVIDVEPGLYEKVYFIANCGIKTDQDAAVTYTYTDGTTETDEHIKTIMGFASAEVSTLGLTAGKKADEYRTYIGAPGALRPPNGTETAPATYAGHIMMYECRVDTSKVLKSISVSAKKAVVYAVTGQYMKSRKMKSAAEAIAGAMNLAELTEADRTTTAAFFDACAILGDSINTEEIGGYEDMVAAKDKFIDVEKVSCKTDIDKVTITAELSGAPSAASVTKENVKLFKNGAEYSGDYTVSLDGTKLVIVTENKMDYENSYSVVLSAAIERQGGFTLGKKYTAAADITAPLSVSDVSLTSGENTVTSLADAAGKSVNVALKVNVTEETKAVVLVAVFSPDGEMHGRFVKTAAVDTVNGLSINEPLAIPENAGEGWHIECIIWNNYTDADRLYNTVIIG